MFKYLALILTAIMLSACNIPNKPIYNDSTIRWEEEPLIAEGSELEEELPQNEVNKLVYVTKSGKKFHIEGCKSLSQSKIEKDYNVAVNEGYTACASCKPD